MVLGEDHPKSGQVQWTRKRRAVGALGQRIGHHRRTSHSLPRGADSARTLCRNSGCHTCMRCRAVNPDVPAAACHGRHALAPAGDQWAHSAPGGAPCSVVPGADYICSFCRTSGRHACLRCRAVSCCVSVSVKGRLHVLGVPRH
jgi:hypothetical protein